jgi:chemotaxis protein MotB
MARKRKPEHVSHERWLVSYADFITLLFAFFVVLYASSQADKGKMARLSVAMQQAFSQAGTPGIGENMPAPSTGNLSPNDVVPAIAPTLVLQPISGLLPDNRRTLKEQRRKLLLEKLERELKAALSEQLKRNEVALLEGPDGLVVSLREIGFFESGSVQIRADALDTFGRIAKLLKDKACNLRVEGHTDDVPIHTKHFDSNWELSTARAINMVRSLIDDYKFPAERLSAAGFGEYHPLTTNATEVGRGINRRVDIVVLEPSGPDIATNEE